MEGLILRNYDSLKLMSSVSSPHPPNGRRTARRGRVLSPVGSGAKR